MDWSLKLRVFALVSATEYVFRGAGGVEGIREVKRVGRLRLPSPSHEGWVCISRSEKLRRKT